jgi:hypothetical protein
MTYHVVIAIYNVCPIIIRQILRTSLAEFAFRSPTTIFSTIEPMIVTEPVTGGVTGVSRQA